MIDADTEFALGVLAKYGMNPDGMLTVQKKSDRQVWRVKDPKGDYALKYIKSCKKAKKIAAVNLYMHRQGIPVIPVVSTLKGKSLVRTERGCFVLFPWLEGQRPSYQTPGMMKRITVLLARFHEASRGYVSTGEPMTDNRLDLNEIYKKKIKKMEWLWEKAQETHDPFTKLFLSEYPGFRLRIEWVLERLPQNTLSELMEESKKDPILGHGDYSHINLLLSSDDKLTVIDMDTVSIALPIRDLSHLLTWIHHLHGSWSKDHQNLVLESYRQVRRLTAEEEELILIDQIFPHKALRLAKKHLENQQKQSVKELKRCLTIDRQKISGLGIDL